MQITEKSRSIYPGGSYFFSSRTLRKKYRVAITIIVSLPGKESMIFGKSVLNTPPLLVAAPVFPYYS